jgi:hypothetical protein
LKGLISMAIENGYPIAQPSPNSRGPRDADQTYRLPEAIAKPIVHGSLDNGDRGVAVPHQTMPNKVLPTTRPPEMARDLGGPAYTSGKPSKPAGRPLPVMGSGKPAGDRR